MNDGRRSSCKIFPPLISMRCNCRLLLDPTRSKGVDKAFSFSVSKLRNWIEQGFKSIGRVNFMAGVGRVNFVLRRDVLKNSENSGSEQSGHKRISPWKSRTARAEPSAEKQKSRTPVATGIKTACSLSPLMLMFCPDCVSLKT